MQKINNDEEDSFIFAGDAANSEWNGPRARKETEHHSFLGG